MKKIIILLTILGSCFSTIYGQNVGIGTSTPLEKLHVVGSIRSDALQTAVAPTAITDKIAWVDGNGKMFTLPNGTAGKILGVVPSTNSFQVKEKNNGTSHVKFSYRVVAKRYYFADHRFGNDPLWGEGDTREYAQKAKPRPIDYEEAVKMDADEKANFKRPKSPKGFYYTDDFPKPEIKRATSSEIPK